MNRGIRIEAHTTYYIERGDVPAWTDEEWDEAVEAARENDNGHDAWDALEWKHVVEQEVQDVILERAASEEIETVKVPKDVL